VDASTAVGGASLAAAKMGCLRAKNSKNGSVSASRQSWPRDWAECPQFAPSSSDRSGDRLHGWAYRIRTSMCREKIHLFDKSHEFGFGRNGPDSRRPLEDNLLCWAELFLTEVAFSPRLRAARQGGQSESYRSSNPLTGAGRIRT
jgi:hypothetical protein